MAFTYRIHEPNKMSLGQKFSNAAHTMKNIFTVGHTIYKVAKVAAPIIQALL